LNVNIIEEKIVNKFAQNENENKEKKEEKEDKDDKVKTNIDIKNIDENIENIEAENLKTVKSKQNEMKEEGYKTKDIKDNLEKKYTKSVNIEKLEEKIQNDFENKNSGKKEIINDSKINENNNIFKHINIENTSKININFDECIIENKNNPINTNTEKINRNIGKNKKDLNENKNREIKNNKDISKKTINLRNNKKSEKIDKNELQIDNNNKEKKDVIIGQIKQNDNGDIKGKENKDKNIIINEKDDDIKRNQNFSKKIEKNKSSKIITNIENDNNHKKIAKIINKKINIIDNKLQKKQNSNIKKDIKKNIEIKQHIKQSSKNIRELSTEKMLSKSIKFKKNNARIPKGNIKRFQNKNNCFSNSFILKSYSKTIEQEEQIKNLKVSKLFKSINDQKEKVKERKPKRFQDKYIKHFVSFNKQNSSFKNESFNKKINNKYNNITTKSFNYKAYIPAKHKNKRCLKNNNQKPKDKIVIDSINRNSYKSNIAKTKKTNNFKKINKINNKMFSITENPNNSSYEKKIIDDDVKIENFHSDGELVNVGKIIEDNSESKNWNEMNDINENNVINNLRSLEVYSSFVFSIKNDKDIKRQSLSVSKVNKNSSMEKNIFKSNNPDELKIEKNKFNYIPEIKNLNQKIEQKSKNIEKIKKLIEYYKKQMVKYDNEIIQIDNWILKEEKERENLQVMVNFLNVQ